MATQELKISIHHFLDKTDDPEILALVLGLLKKFSFIEQEGIAGYEADGSAISDDELVQSILESSRDVAVNGSISHTDMKQMLGLDV